MDVVTFALCKKMVNDASFGGGDTTIVTEVRQEIAEVKQEVIEVQQEVVVMKEDIELIKEDLSDNVEAMEIVNVVLE